MKRIRMAFWGVVVLLLSVGFIIVDYFPHYESDSKIKVFDTL